MGYTYVLTDHQNGGTPTGANLEDGVRENPDYLVHIEKFKIDLNLPIHTPAPFYLKQTNDHSDLRILDPYMTLVWTLNS